MTNIISIDGGGLKGIIPIMVLEELERMYGGSLLPKLSLMAGTSTGGIISLGYANRRYSEEPRILDMYMDYGDEIFPIRTKVGAILNNASSFLSPKYKRTGLEAIAEDYFGCNSLGMLGCNTMVTAYDVIDSKVYMFKSRSNPEALALDAALATSAAPTYFPPYKYKRMDLVDGGIYINNPTMAAVAEVVKHHEYYGMKDKSLDNLNVLSLGTGKYVKPIPNSNKWGKLEWITRITNTMMDATSQAVVYECEQLLPNFVRIDTTLNENIQMDDATKVIDLYNYGKKLTQSKEFYLLAEKFLSKFA